MLRNAKVHIKRKGDLNAKEHDRLLAKIEKLIWKNPEHVFPGDKHLLEEDFGILGKARALNQHLLVTEMEALMAATSNKRKANKGNGSEKEYDLTGASSAIVNEPLDLTGEQGSKGSSAWQQKYWK